MSMIFGMYCVDAAFAGPCDFVLRWDQDTIAGCFKSLKSEIDSLRTQVGTLEAENRALNGYACFLAMDVQKRVSGANVGFVVDEACADLRARAAAKEKATKPKKP